MATFKLPKGSIEVPRDGMLVDSGVLIAAFLPSEPAHQDARDFLNESTTYVIPFVVITEAWGLLVGSRKRRDCALRMLTWLREPPNVILFPTWEALFDAGKTLCAHYGIDMVDAVLMCLASELSSSLSIRPPLAIATYDMRDFTKTYGAASFRCFDLRERDYF